MPLIISKYKSPRLLRHSHLHTVCCALFRSRPQISYVRERLELRDGDFVDLDWAENNSKKLLILTHGMEGSSNSKYILHSVLAAQKRGFSALAWNMRGCSGESNRKLNFYHSGLTSDLDAVVARAISRGYREIYLAGFSLGGNLTLLYVARAANKLNKKIKNAIAISAPVDLISSQEQLERPENRAYLMRFLKDFKKKFARKRNSRGIYIDIKNFHREIKTLAHLDAKYTAPWSGFSSEYEYYAKSSSLPLFKNIRIPTLLLNPLDDSFLSAECYPTEFAQKSRNFFLETPNSGGHCGLLMDLKFSDSYMEKRIFEFIDSGT